MTMHVGSNHSEPYCGPGGRNDAFLFFIPRPMHLLLLTTGHNLSFELNAGRT